MSATVESWDHFENLKKAADDPAKIHLVIQVDRLGGQLFAVRLEYEHYPPRSGKNKNFDFNIVNWQEFAWFVVGIPRQDYGVAEQVAADVGLKLEDGSPVAITSEGTFLFPISGPGVFTLTSNSKSKVYDNDQEQTARLRAGEARECDKIIKADERKIRDELTQKGYQPAQVERILTAWNNGDFQYDEPVPPAS